MNEFNSVYVGLDVHKETIAVGVARSGRGKPEYFGEIKNSVAAVRKLLRRLSPDGEVLQICYEAGPCGYGLYRQIKSLGHDCEVVAPSLIPRKAGERMKTDRRDGLKLAHEHRAGGLTAVWVPGEEQEAVRDLTRAREDMKAIETKARQRLGAFLLRHGRVFAGKSRWTQAHFRWLETVKFDQPLQQLVLQEYIDALTDAFAHGREQGESFQAWIARLGKRNVKELIKPFMSVPPHAEDPSFYSDWSDVREFTIGDMGIGECAGEALPADLHGNLEVEIAQQFGNGCQAVDGQQQEQQVARHDPRHDDGRMPETGRERAGDGGEDTGTRRHCKQEHGAGQRQRGNECHSVALLPEIAD